MIEAAVDHAKRHRRARLDADRRAAAEERGEAADDRAGADFERMHQSRPAISPLDGSATGKRQPPSSIEMLPRIALMFGQHGRDELYAGWQVAGSIRTRSTTSPAGCVSSTGPGHSRSRGANNNRPPLQATWNGCTLSTPPASRALTSQAPRCNPGRLDLFRPHRAGHFPRTLLGGREVDRLGRHRESAVAHSRRLQEAAPRPRLPMTGRRHLDLRLVEIQPRAGQDELFGRDRLVPGDSIGGNAGVGHHVVIAADLPLLPRQPKFLNAGDRRRRGNPLHRGGRGRRRRPCLPAGVRPG